MARSLAGLSDVELPNVVDTRGSRKRNKRDLVSEEFVKDGGDHNTDPVDDKEKVVDLESEFSHTVEGIPTDHKDDRTKEEEPSLNHEECRGDKGTAFEHMDSKYMTDHNEGIEDSVSNEVMKNHNGYSIVVEEKNSKENEAVEIEHPFVDDVIWCETFSTASLVIHDFTLPAIQPFYSSARKRSILWMHYQIEVISHGFTGPYMITTRFYDVVGSRALTIGLEYLGSFIKNMESIVLDLSACYMSLELSTVLAERRSILFDPSHDLILSCRRTTHEMKPDIPCELMPNCSHRDSEEHSLREAVTQNSDTLDVSAVFDLERREVTQDEKEWMTTVTKPISDGKSQFDFGKKWYLNVSQNHPCFQNIGYTVFVIPLLPRQFNQIYIPLHEASSSPPVPAALYVASRQVSGLPNSPATAQTPQQPPRAIIAGINASHHAPAVPVSDEDGGINDQITSRSGTDAYTAMPDGYMTGTSTGDQTAFEREGLRLGGSSPVSLIAQETDQQTTCTNCFQITKNQSPRAICSRGNKNLPTPALPVICSNREEPSQAAGSRFAQEQSPNETGNTPSSSSDLGRLWDAPGAPDIFPIRSTTSNDNEKEVAALKGVTSRGNGNTDESKARTQNEAVKKQQRVSANAVTKKEPSPLCPYYKEINTRIAFFKKWPAGLQQPKEMAECGFYYTGSYDMVRCFACGGHFKNWVPGRNPWIEHARCFSQCAYVLHVKGEEFINCVQSMTKESDGKEDYTVHHDAPWGGAESSKTDNNSANCTAVRDVASSSAVECGAVGGAAACTADNREKQKYLQKDAAQSVLDRGYQPNAESVVMKRGDEEVEGDLCKICNFDTICKIFLPCLHSVACSDCAVTVRKCPVCRTSITGLMTIGNGNVNC